MTDNVVTWHVCAFQIPDTLGSKVCETHLQERSEVAEETSASGRPLA